MFMLWLFVFGQSSLDVNCLSWPRYISPWVLMDSNDVSTTDKTFDHDFGVVPMKVEVQVRSPSTGYIYPGIGSGHGDNDQGLRGGVMCVFNINQVRLLGATNDNSALNQAYIIYTGNLSWTSGHQEMSTTGYVRARVWHPDDFPTPDETVSKNLKAGNNQWDYSFTHNHGFGATPGLTIVQYFQPFSSYGEPLYNWHAQAQGSNTHKIGSSIVKWGALTYAVSANSLRLWAPTTTSYSEFSFCKGWGRYVTTSCSFIRASVRVYMWSSLPGVEHVQLSGTITTSDTNTKQFNVPVGFNADSDLITVVYRATDDDNDGYHFSSSGSAQIDGMDGCGGVVYGYSDTARTVNVWYPTDTDNDGHIVSITDMASGWNNQRSDNAELYIDIWKVNASTITTPATTTTSTVTTTTSTTSTTTPTTTSTTSTNTPSTTSTTSTTTPTATSTTSTTNPSTTSTTSTTTPSTTSTTSTTTTTSTPPTTSTSSPIITVPGVQCFNTTSIINLTLVLEKVHEIVANLTVPAKDTSKFRRSLSSAQDSRQSSMYIGLLGNVIFALLGAFIVIPDLLALLRGIYVRWHGYY